jgi:hypothetical protein
MPTTPPTRRRGLQFGLARVFVLTALIAIAWAVSSQWQVPCIVDQRVSMRNVGGRFVNNTEYIMGTRPPMPLEIAKGGIVGSALVVAVGCAAEFAILRFRRRTNPD